MASEWRFVFPDCSAVPVLSQILLVACDWIDNMSIAWALGGGPSLNSCCVYTSCLFWQFPIIYETSPRTLAQPNIHGWFLLSFISKAQRKTSLPLCSILTLFYLFIPILGQCEGSCILAFVGLNEAGFDSISYQVSSFVYMGRRAEKCSFNWCHKRRQRKTRQKSNNCFFSLQSWPLSKTCYSSIFQISWESYLSTTAFPYFLETYITGCIINVYASCKEESNIS